MITIRYSISISLTLMITAVCAFSQDSVIAGPSNLDIAITPDSISIATSVVSDEVVQPLISQPSSTQSTMPDSASAEREVESYIYITNQLEYALDSYVVPLDIGQYANNLSPQFRQRLYDKYSKNGSIVPAIINFFPIPFLGSLLLKDNFGGYILLGAAILLYIGAMGKATMCTECQTPADIMLYTALGLGLWAAVRPFYLYERNNEYNKTLAAVLNPPSISFLSLNPALRYSMAGVIVPAMQLTIGF